MHNVRETKLAVIGYLSLFPRITFIVLTFVPQSTARQRRAPRDLHHRNLQALLPSRGDVGERVT
jgi:hypothetical protein